MRVPNLRPLILPSACEETQGLAVLALLGETAKAFASLGVALGTAQSDALEVPRFDIVWRELAREVEDVQRIARPAELDQCPRRGAQRLEFEYAVWSFLSENENVARPLLAPRHLDAALPRLQRLPELVDVADFEGLPVRLAEVGELLIDRARPSPPPSAEGRLDCFLDRIALRFDNLGIEPSVLQRIALHALPCDVKRQPVAECIGEDRAARAQRVPRADFVPDIGIVQGQAGDDKLGKEQILEHVEVGRPAAAFGAGAVRNQTGR